MRPGDTAPEAHRVQLEAHARLSGAERVALAFEQSEAMRKISAAGIQSRHPEYSPECVEYALRRLLLGDDLFRAAWPGAPLLDP